ERAAEVRDEHATALHVEGNADALHKVGEEDLWRRSLACGRIQWRTVHGIPSRRVAAVGPVQETSLEIEIEIDRLRQPFVEHLDVAACGGCLARPTLEICAAHTSLP